MGNTRSGKPTGISVPDVAFHNAAEARPGPSGRRQARGHCLHFQKTHLLLGLPIFIHGCSPPFPDSNFNQN